MSPSAIPKLLIAAAGCLLLPVWAPGESCIQSDLQHSKQVAAAHVMFKIVIPIVLSMEIVADARAGEPALAVSGNDRKVYRVSTGGGDASHPSLILSAAAGRSIAQIATCDSADPAQAAPRVHCTVSMP